MHCGSKPVKTYLSDAISGIVGSVAATTTSARASSAVLQRLVLAQSTQFNDAPSGANNEQELQVTMFTYLLAISKDFVKTAIESTVHGVCLFHCVTEL